MENLLTEGEWKELHELENEIGRHLAGLLALWDVRDKRLYRDDYSSFEEYRKAKWDLPKDEVEPLDETFRRSLDGKAA